jgi:hypothetical protein
MSRLRLWKKELVYDTCNALDDLVVPSMGTTV